jgi:hypothetical protein
MFGSQEFLYIVAININEIAHEIFSIKELLRTYNEGNDILKIRKNKKIFHHVSL